MSSDILTSLHLDKELLSSKIIVIKEINGCDSSFITSCVIGHCIKNKNAVLLISTHNSVIHYHNVGLKMNYNLQKNIQLGLVEVYYAGEDYVNMLLSNNNITSDYFINNVKEKIYSIKDRFGSVNIIMDGVSHLFDLQFTLREVNVICNNLIGHIGSQNNSFLLFHCNEASFNDATHVMSNLLCHKASTIVEVGNLASGLSADVSGHYTVKHMNRKFEDEYTYVIDIKPFLYLFKLFDRGVKLLAPGTVYYL